MPLHNDIVDFSKTLGALQAVIALDVGSKTIGVAASDRTRLVATGVTTIKRTKFTNDADKLWDIMDEYESSALVVGLPLELSGEKGKAVQSVKQFAYNLLKQRDIPILLWDERLSTVSADNAMLEADMSRQKRAEKIDQVAATIILQHALDAMQHQLPLSS